MYRDSDTSWNTIQIVQPGESFSLFHPTRNGTTMRCDDHGSFGGMASRIRLRTGLAATLNISSVAAPYALPRGSVLAPFDRSLGYPLDQEDFSLAGRYKKIARLKRELMTMVEGLGLVIYVAGDSLPFYSGIVREEGSSPAATSLMRLHLTLTFLNGASFTAQAASDRTRRILHFRTFFPTDTGPLPAGDALPPELSPLSIEEGFRLLLPFDAAQLETIRAAFLVLYDGF